MTTTLTAQFEKRFTRQAAIQAELQQPVDSFSVTVLFGPSGCGKTTILRCLAGLERPEAGRIQWGAETWFDAAQRVFRRPQQRRVGYLFQEYALFPHLTVAANVAYGLRGLDAAQRQTRVSEMLSRLDLDGLETRFPHQISGGQQQRVALARALACQPQLLLLDEPLSALDTTLRERLRGQLRQWLMAGNVPAIVVTHDRTEAIALADQVVVLDAGRVLQAGPPDEVFGRPADLKVAQVVGVETVVAARIKQHQDGLVRIDVHGCELLAVAPEFAESSVYACIRAEDVVLQKGPSSSTSARNRVEGTIVSLVPEGPLVRVTLECGFPLMALVTRPAREELQLQPGDQVTAMIKVPAIHLLARTPASEGLS